MTWNGLAHWEVWAVGLMGMAVISVGPKIVDAIGSWLKENMGPSLER